MSVYVQFTEKNLIGIFETFIYGSCSKNVLSWNFQENYPFKRHLIKDKLNIKILYLFILIKNQNIKYLTNGEQNKAWQLIMNIITNAYLYLQLYRWSVMTYCKDIRISELQYSNWISRFRRTNFSEFWAMSMLDLQYYMQCCTSVDW